MDCLMSMFQLYQVEHEIMDLYKTEFGIDPPAPIEYKFYTRDEQVERYARNMAFWDKLYKKHCDHDILKNPPTKKI